MSKDQNEPHFERDNYSVGSSLMENTPIGFSVITVKASDKDVSNDK